MHHSNHGFRQPNFRTECGKCQSLAWKSSKMQEDLETNKVLLAEKEDQIADLLAGNDDLSCEVPLYSVTYTELAYAA